MYRSSKIYPPSRGLSICYRNPMAHSHCNQLHGYALGIHFEFEAKDLDAQGFVVDFGGLKHLKGILDDAFDHKLLVSENDPQLDYIASLAGLGIADVVTLPAVGCEAWAEMVYEVAEGWLEDAGFAPRVHLTRVTVSEHEANSASFEKENPNG